MNRIAALLRIFTIKGLHLRKQKLDVFRTKVANQTVLRADDGVGKVPLRLLKLKNLFFHRVARD